MVRRVLAILVLLAFLVASAWGASSGPPGLYANDGTYLGALSANEFDPNSISNPYGRYGSPYSPTSINNPYSTYGSPYSSNSASNPYALNAPAIYAPDGTYLGRLSANPYDPDSISNPYGRYGSPYSPTSINNPYSTYGSPYSSNSANNSYATSPCPASSPQVWGDGVGPLADDAYRLRSTAAEKRRSQYDDLAQILALIAAASERHGQSEALSQPRPPDPRRTIPTPSYAATADRHATAPEHSSLRAALGLPAYISPSDAPSPAFLTDLTFYEKMVADGVMSLDGAAGIMQGLYGPQPLRKSAQTPANTPLRAALGLPAYISPSDAPSPAFLTNLAFYEKMVADGVLSLDAAAGIMRNLYGPQPLQ